MFEQFKSSSTFKMIVIKRKNQSLMAECKKIRIYKRNLLLPVGIGNHRRIATLQLHDDLQVSSASQLTHMSNERCTYLGVRCILSPIWT